MPVSKLVHIHWIQKHKIIVGFEWRLNSSEIGAAENQKWHALRGALTRNLPQMEYTSSPTRGNKWPFRWQIAWNCNRERLGEIIEELQNDTEERRLMINNTRTALEVVGEVFGEVFGRRKE